MIYHVYTYDLPFFGFSKPGNVDTYDLPPQFKVYTYDLPTPKTCRKIGFSQNNVYTYDLPKNDGLNL